MARTEFPAQTFTLVLEEKLDIVRERIGQAVQTVGADILQEVIFESSQLCPVYAGDKGAKHSAPGAYPFRETGEFVDGLNMAYDENTMTLSLYSQTHDHHGWYLQNKLRDGSTRPYATLALKGQNWAARIAKVARGIFG